MLCKDFKFYIERYHDKILSAQRRMACEEHLETCSQCRRDLADIEKMESLFKGSSFPSAPGCLTGNIMRIVRNSAYTKKHDENMVIQWWKETVIPARLTFIVLLFVLVVASVFASKDLWGSQYSKTSVGLNGFDTFSASQDGSLEEVYLQLIMVPDQGGEQ